MSSRPSRRPACLRAVVVIALFCSLFAVSPAYAAGTMISGKVTKPSGSGLGESVVDLYREYSDGYSFEKSVKTKSDGTYSFSSLPKDRYVVGFAAESKVYAAEFWSDAKDFEDARVISLGSSKVSGINAKLVVGGTVRGRVTAGGTQAHPVADAEVAAYRSSPRGEWTFDKSAQTSSDGTFAIAGLSEGAHTLEFNPPTDGPDADLALEYWRDERTFSHENPIDVRSGQTHDGYDAALAPGGRISGRVTGPDGEPVVDAPVFGYSLGSPDVGNIAFTEDDGTYVMKGLSPGYHHLEFQGPFSLDHDYLPEFWDDQSSFNRADEIPVVVGETTTGKDAQLAVDGTPIANTGRPSIIGTPKAGESLDADPGAWSPENVELTYRWLVDGSPVMDGDSTSFRLVGAYVGKTISVEVTASRPGFTSRTVTSASTPKVLGQEFTLEQAPTIGDATRVGDRARANPGRWNVYEPSRSYQLIADGVDVPGATAQTHEVTAGMLGKRLAFRESVSFLGYVPASATTEPSAPIREGLLTPVAKPGFAGGAFAGEPIAASTGSWDQSGQTDTTLSFGYQWLVDGTEIDGAEAGTFTPTSAHSGKALTVEVTASRPGYTPATSESDPTTVNGARPPITQGSDAPSILGSPRVGSTLTANAGDWEPTPSSFAYQWLADDVAIDGATASTFRPASSEGGKRITVRVTASRSGYASGTATSAATAPIVTSTPFGAPQNLESTGTTVTTVDLAWAKVDGAAKYRIYHGIGSGTRTKVEVGDVTTASLKGLKPDTTYSIDIAALTSSGTRSPYSPRINVRTRSLVPPSGLKVTDRTSTSLTLTWTKVAGVPKYRIYHGITSSTTRTKVEVGDVGTTKITGLKPDTTYAIDIASLLSDGTRSAYTPRIGGTTAD